MLDLNEVLTFSEAAEKWGFSDGNTLRKAVERNKFEVYEIRKSGNVWLTTYTAMQRVFGNPSTVEFIISYADIIKIAAKCIKEKAEFHTEVKEIYTEAMKKIEQGGQVAVAQSERHPNLIARIFTDKADLDSWFQYFEYRLQKKKATK